MGREQDHMEESDPLLSLSNALAVFLDFGFLDKRPNKFNTQAMSKT